MTPQIFKRRSDPNTLPAPPNSSDGVGLTDRGRARHVDRRNDVLDRNEHDYVKAHYNNHTRQGYSRKDATLHVEEVRWHDLVLPRLRAYGLEVVPHPGESPEVFALDKLIANARMTWLQEELNHEKEIISHAELHSSRTMGISQAGLDILKNWNSHINELEEKLQQFQNDPNSLCDVQVQFAFEDDIDRYLVAEQSFIDRLAQYPHLNVDRVAIWAMEEADKLRPKSAKSMKHRIVYKSLLHDQVEARHLREFSLDHKDAQSPRPASHFFNEGRYWALVYVQKVMLEREYVERLLREGQGDKKHLKHLKAEKYESHYIQQQIWEQFAKKPPTNSNEAAEAFAAIEQNAMEMERRDKKRAYTNLPDGHQGDVTGGVHR